MDYNENNLAEQYAEFLSYMQRPNGAFAGLDGKECVFDTGQALRGLLRASEHWNRLRPFALETADYVISRVEKNGRIPSICGDKASEFVHVFVLPVLVKAAQILNKSGYLEVAKKSLVYYKKNSPDILNGNCLTHFLAYIIDGFVDMGEADFVRPLATGIFSSQRKDGSIPAFANVKWTCRKL